ncbi:MAG: hypothetical protein EOO01_29690 [Chitinophagaceae bacterium]|nr:MAG: hypothetical protein EOO01_29690 [Chitinophagaceae bacterium]
MNIDYQEHLPADFNNDSRVWIYQCNRLFTIHEALQIEDILKTFVASWHSHGTPVTGYANLFFGQFIVLIADETRSGVSGCSTDSSVRMIKDIEQMFNVLLFDRLLLGFLVKERVQMVPMAQLKYAIENNFIEPSALYFNNTVLTLEQLRGKWLMPLKESWVAKDHRFSSLFEKSEVN